MLLAPSQQKVGSEHYARGASRENQSFSLQLLSLPWYQFEMV